MPGQPSLPRYRFLSLLLVLLCPAACAAEGFYAEVTQVIDGDSLLLADGRQVRLIGVNAPELGKDGAADQPLAREAHGLLAELLAGKRIFLQLDQEHHDRYGRLLAYVTAPEGRSAQELLLRKGLAFMVAVPPNLSHLSSHQAAEDEARRQRRGVWGHSAYLPLPAERLELSDSGFRLVSGKIRRVGKSPHAYYFQLAPRLTLVCKRENWERHFFGPPEALYAKRIVVRGWVTQYHNELRMHLMHPAMVTLLD